MEELKRILIVDDSEIDRGILRNMLHEEFQVIEVDNGYSALDVILKKGEYFDAVLLDVSMPLFDGLSVLRILRENNLRDVQIFMITAEATKENIEKASQYNIAEFIKKPFDREEVLKRVRAKLGVVKKVSFTKADIDETRRYISDLEFVYNRYLSFSGKDRGKDERRAHFMRILLEKSPDMKMKIKTEYDYFKMEMICKAAYLCNIGNMLLQNIPAETKPENETRDCNIHQQHTVMGADLLRLNYSKHCKQFVDICAEMCLHHHERYDGGGYPHGIYGHYNLVYTQICGLLEKFQEFEELFFYHSKHNAMQFDYVINQLKQDRGFVSDQVFLMLLESKAEIVKYYDENNI